MASDTVTELIKLAREKSQESRNKLVENITDLFLSDEGRLSEHERALMSDILSKLVMSVEVSLRKSLAEALLKTDVQMPEIVNLLAHDDIEIAKPLLEKSQLLQDKELIEIVRMRTDEHRLSIAIRDEVSADLSDALVEYGSQDVIEALLRNQDSSLSSRAMEYIVAESKRVDRFQEPLISREDLPLNLAYKMYWWVSAALRKRIADEYDVDSTFLDKVMQRATQEALVKQKEGLGTIEKAMKLVRRLSEQGELTHAFLLNSLRQQKLPVFIAGLAHMCQLDFNTVWVLFSDKRTESMAILARAVGMDRNDFASMNLLISSARDKQGSQSPAMVKSVLDLYDSIDEKTALEAISYWQQNKEYQLAMDELENVKA